MNDFRGIQHHIDAARLERSRVMGEIIATLIVNAWRRLQQLGAWSSAQFVAFNHSAVRERRPAPTPIHR